MKNIAFDKFHALGNDYLIIDAQEQSLSMEQLEALARQICDRHKGIGADGILYGPVTIEPGIVDGSNEQQPGHSSFSLRIFNPDGSEAERSGNGIRIFAAYVYSQKYSREMTFFVKSLKDPQNIQVNIIDYPQKILLEMEPAKFHSKHLSRKNLPDEILNFPLQIDGHHLIINCVDVGNPHCVIECAEISPSLARELGPKIEKDALFSNHTNVQFLRILDRQNIRIEIWERGAGYTTSSGTSSVAAASVAYKLGHVDSDVFVHTPGGILSVHHQEKKVSLIGPVSFVGSGSFLFEGV